MRNESSKDDMTRGREKDAHGEWKKQDDALGTVDDHDRGEEAGWGSTPGTAVARRVRARGTRADRKAHIKTVPAVRSGKGEEKEGWATGRRVGKGRAGEVGQERVVG